MMDAGEETTQREKKPRVGGDTLGNSPTQAVAVTKVLEDDNLLREIIVRVGFPTTLVCADFVCKRWLGHASDPRFLSRFRKLHQPRLLGYYITESSVLNQGLGATSFVPMLPQPPELSAVIRRLESYNFGAHQIKQCQNGSVLTKCSGGTKLTHGVHRPLCAEKGMQIVPPLPPTQNYNRKKFSAIVSKEEANGLSYLYVLGESTGEAGKSTTHVYMLQDGVWRMLISATCLHGFRFSLEALLIDNKIYMPAVNGDDIIVLDLTASSFNTIQLLQGMKYCYFQSMLSRADDASSLYLIHVEEFQLCVWVHKGDNWLLVDTICLHEMLAILGMSDHMFDEDDIDNMQLIQVGDNAQFVFLQIAQFFFYLDIKCRTLCKVYEDTVNYRCFGSIHPFIMIWPPTFPAIKDNPARKLSDGQ